MREIIKTIYSNDRQNRVLIFRNLNGTFSFDVEHFSKNEYENCWIPSFNNSFCDTAERAEQEARSRVDWLAELGEGK